MAYDKVIDSTLLEEDLILVADAIRAKNETAEKLDFPQGFVSAIESIKDNSTFTNLAKATGTIIKDNYRINSSGNIGASSGCTVISFKNPKQGQKCKLVYRGAFISNGSTNIAAGSSSSVGGTPISTNLNEDSYLNEQGDFYVTIPADKSLAWIHFSFAGLTSKRFPIITIDEYIGNGGHIPD